MKKLIIVILLLIGTFTLSACAERRNQAPVFHGVVLNPVIVQGEAYNPLAGVEALDREDGNITSSIVMSGFEEDDINYAGNYTITLTVKDSDNLSTTVTIELTILLPDLRITILDAAGKNETEIRAMYSNLNVIISVIYVDTTTITAGQFIRYVNNVVGDKVQPGSTISVEIARNVPITTTATTTTGTGPTTTTVPPTTTTTVPTTVTTTTTTAAPTAATFFGVIPNQTYYIGSGAYDPKAGVSAIDQKDGNISSSIVVIGTYLLDSPGIYTITLRVTNSSGLRTSTSIILTVMNSEVPLTFTTQPITITLWHAMGEVNQGLMQKYANSFMALYPNVTVIIPAGVGNYDTLKGNMINAITANAMPNMVQGYPDHVAEYLNGKAVLNLNPYIFSTQWGLNGADAFEDIIPSYRAENSQYDLAGTFYSLPFNKSTEVMIYNKTAFTALGIPVPQTWQDIIAAAPQLKAYGETIAEQKVRAANVGKTEAQLAPLISSAKNAVVAASYDSTGNAFITFTRQFGGAYTGINFTTFKGQYLWRDNVQTIAAMNFLKTNSSIITLPEFWNQQYASTPFVNQQTFVTIGSSAGIRYNVPATDPTTGQPLFEIGVAPVPFNADYPNLKAVIQQGTNISLMKTGTAQEQLASWLLLKHMISINNTIDWAMQTGYLPVRISAYSSTTYQNFLNSPQANQLYFSMSANAAFLQSTYMFYDPAFIGSSRARTQVGLALERIMLGDGNITEALQVAFNEANLGG
jgi:multiple sugar transport system substrate-binding protein